MVPAFPVPRMQHSLHRWLAEDPVGCLSWVSKKEGLSCEQDKRSLMPKSPVLGLLFNEKCIPGSTMLGTGLQS